MSGLPGAGSAQAASGGDPPPVIAIDGPAASGKGTIAERVAAALGYHWLDSGALYRLVALEADLEGVDLDDAGALAELAADLDARFLPGRVELDGADVTHAIRTPEVSSAASRVAVHAPVRAALYERQRAFRAAARPGRGGARHGDGRVPGRGDQGVPDRQRRGACGSPA